MKRPTLLYFVGLLMFGEFIHFIAGFIMINALIITMFQELSFLDMMVCQ